MALQFYLWSRTAASNATADPAVNFAEGQAPSSVNDSMRAVMASAAGYRDDISGAIVTTGTSTAYAITSYEVFDTLAHMANQMIAFSPHATNGATVTLNVDGLGAKPLRSAPSTDLLAGVLIQGTPYVATYNNSDAVWYLQNFYVSPYSIPLGGSIDYWGSTAPNSAMALAYGQAISRATYATLFSLISTTYGVGDGSTTFNIPDLRGRVVAGKDDMGGSAASRLTATYFGTSAAALGAVGGGESQTLTAAQIPSITSTVSTTTATNNVGTIPISSGAVSSLQTSGSATTNITPANTSGSWSGSTSLAGTGSGTATSNNTSGAAHPIVQPTIVANKLMRVL